MVAYPVYRGSSLGNSPHSKSKESRYRMSKGQLELAKAYCLSQYPASILRLSSVNERGSGRSVNKNLFYNCNVTARAPSRIMLGCRLHSRLILLLRCPCGTITINRRIPVMNLKAGGRVERTPRRKWSLRGQLAVRFQLARSGRTGYGVGGRKRGILHG